MTSRKTLAENRDIRAWAADQGYDLAERGAIPPTVRQAWRERDDIPGGADVGPDSRELERLEAIAADGPAVPTYSGPEVAPVAPERKKFWAPRIGEGGAPRKRESLERLAVFAWGGMAETMQRAGRIPTSRMLAKQAPVAGVILDDALRGTLIDKMLQPLARTGKRGEAVFALIGPPILVEMILRYPERRGTLVPMLAMALEGYVDIAGPKLAAAEKRRQKRIEEIGENGIQEMIEEIFAPFQGVPEGMADGGSRAA